MRRADSSVQHACERPSLTLSGLASAVLDAWCGGRRGWGVLGAKRRSARVAHLGLVTTLADSTPAEPPIRVMCSLRRGVRDDSLCGLEPGHLLPGRTDTGLPFEQGERRDHDNAQRNAEEVGFEPTDPCRSHDFQSCRFGRSRTPPTSLRPLSLHLLALSCAVAGFCATDDREPSQGRKAAALSGFACVPQGTWLLRPAAPDVRSGERTS